ncbi:hypothetical protein KA405_06745, partial [Patescibacteria group bacterium]|nr:hypothetical protein [Patescibacteria group bacterium]
INIIKKSRKNQSIQIHQIYCQIIIINKIITNTNKLKNEILQNISGLNINEKHHNAFFQCFLYSPTSFILHFQRIKNLSKVSIFAGCKTRISGM